MDEQDACECVECKRCADRLTDIDEVMRVRRPKFFDDLQAYRAIKPRKGLYDALGRN